MAGAALAIALAAGVTALAAAPVLLLCTRHGARWRWLLLGIASWVVALVLKLVVNSVLWTAGLAGLPPGAQAAAVGFVSAAMELGTAALLLSRPGLRRPDVLLFGAGIGGFEALCLLPWALLGTLSGDGPAAALAALFLLERAITLVGHVASRVLVHASRERPLAILVAFALFVLVDGTAAYGQMAEWDFADPAVYGGILLFIAAAGAVEAGAAWWFWRSSG